MQVDLLGYKNVGKLIAGQKFAQFRIHDIRPSEGKPASIKFECGHTNNPQDAASEFMDWAKMIYDSNPNNGTVYYLELSKWKTLEDGTIQNSIKGAGKVEGTVSCVSSFVLHERYNTNWDKDKPETGASLKGYRSDSEFNLAVKNKELEIENAAFKKDIEELKKMMDQLTQKEDLFDEDEEEDEEEYYNDGEEQEETFLGIPVQMLAPKLLSLIDIAAAKWSGGALSGEAINQYSEIKKVYPQMDEVLKLIAIKSKSNPKEVVEFFELIRTNLGATNTENNEPI